MERLPQYVSEPQKPQCELGAAQGQHKWNDLYYFGALAASRHATIHIFSGVVAEGFIINNKVFIFLKSGLSYRTPSSTQFRVNRKINP